MTTSLPSNPTAPSTALPAVTADLNGQRVLVTGGLGFIGSNLARRLVDLGAHVTVVDALTPNFGGNLANLAGYTDRIDLRVSDVVADGLLADVLPGQAMVFNLAGHVSHLDSMTHPLVDLEANLRAQIVLLEACRQHCPQARLVFASTRQIYGRPQYLPVDEAHPLDPVDVNGINKMAAEAYHTLYAKVYGMQTVSLRLTNVFGPRLRIKDARQTFLGIWLRKVVENDAIEVWGGDQRRDLTYVDDVVDAFLAAAQLTGHAGKVFNLGGSAPITLLNLAETLLHVSGSGRIEIHAFPQERKMIDIGDYFADDSSFRALTGWCPQVPLEEGLLRSVNYYRQHLKAYC
jgi:UDP-glucose 4-epimerase